MPRRTREPEQALCPDCSASFTVRKRARFCSRRCQSRFADRMAAEGKLLAPLVKAMMATRAGGGRKAPTVNGQARSELTRIARLLNDADRAAGRPPATAYVERCFADGTLYMDRRRLPSA